MRVGRSITRFSAPGPSVAMQTPGRPVSRPCVAAMNAADCSCRVSTSSCANCVKDFDDVEIFLSGHTKDVLDTLVLQRCHQQVGSFGHGLSP